MGLQKHHNGFTLIELLVCMFIIGILTAISISSYSRAKLRTRDVQRKSQVSTIASALESYRSANNIYAPAFYGSSSGVCGNGSRNNRIDQTGLGDCYYNINYTATNDPLFTPISGIDYAGYLLTFMSKPTVIPGGTITSGLGNFPYTYDKNSVGPDFSSGAINYRAQNSYYVVRTVLENKNTIGTPDTSGSCAGVLNTNNNDTAINFKPSTNNVNVDNWRDGIYNIPDSPTNTSSCNSSQYKIFQKSSLIGIR